MHDTAYEVGRRFFQIYATASSTIVEIGAANVNGTLRDFRPSGAVYIGLDLAVAPCVDVVIAPELSLPLASGCADIVISSSTFEHDAFFWETFLEMARIAKPGGVLYISAPSNGKYHRYPVDNWRFYPNSGRALVRWARKNGHELLLLESFMAERMQDVWNDFCAVIRKGELPPGSVLPLVSADIACVNRWRHGRAHVERERESSEDMVLIAQLRAKVGRLTRDLDAEAADEARREADTQTHARMTAQAAAHFAEVERLRDVIRAMEASFLWRMSAPLRWLTGRRSHFR